jgi:hypothetical protein
VINVVIYPNPPVLVNILMTDAYCDCPVVRTHPVLRAPLVPGPKDQGHSTQCRTDRTASPP